VKHLASPDFWEAYASLPAQVQRLANRNYRILKANPNHPSLHFKRVGRFRSVRVGLHYRALGVNAPDGVVWFWIGSHAEYDKLIGG
jgi:hypothetical protein